MEPGLQALGLARASGRLKRISPHGGAFLGMGQWDMWWASGMGPKVSPALWGGKSPFHPTQVIL